jgi:hypothetical protein
MRPGVGTRLSFGRADGCDASSGNAKQKVAAKWIMVFHSGLLAGARRSGEPCVRFRRCCHFVVAAYAYGLKGFPAHQAVGGTRSDANAR